MTDAPNIIYDRLSWALFLLAVRTKQMFDGVTFSEALPEMRQSTCVSTYPTTSVECTGMSKYVHLNACIFHIDNRASHCVSSLRGRSASLHLMHHGKRGTLHPHASMASNYVDNHQDSKGYDHEEVTPCAEKNREYAQLPQHM